MKTFAMMILGCKVNDYEATCLKNQLLQEYEEVSFKEKADIYIIFTCCVTNVAESKSRKMIHHARSLNPDAYIVAVGCYVQMKGSSPELEDVDLLIGSTKKDRIIEMIRENVRADETEDLTNARFEELYLDRYPGRSKAFLKVQDGCNQFCAYCIIPYTRGRERSGDHQKLIKQAEILSKTSKELVLTGIHTGRYFDGEFHLSDLLKELEKIKDLETIRLSSIEITEITDEIIDLMKNSDKLAHHLHIPLQAGSDAILKAMHRPYTFEEFYQRVSYIREQIPDISISTDLVLGFPGEGEKEFEETLQNLDRISFSFIHAFPYARKKGTVADKMEGHMPNSIKKERVLKVLKEEEKHKLNYARSFIGKEAYMLVEKTEEGRLYGYLKQYVYVSCTGNAEIGDVVKVMIDEANGKGVFGHVVI